MEKENNWSAWEKQKEKYLVSEEEEKRKKKRTKIFGEEKYLVRGGEEKRKRKEGEEKLLRDGDGPPCSRMCKFWSSFGRSEFTIVEM